MSNGDRLPFKKKPKPENLETTFERQLPAALEAERSVIGSIMLLPETYDEVAMILRADDFYDDANRRLFMHLIAMNDAGQQIDPTLLIQRIKDTDEYEIIGGRAYLAEVASQVTTAAHAEYYAKIVKEKATLRKLIHAGTDILRGAYDPTADPREMLSKAEERVFGILDNEGGGNVAVIRDVLQQSIDRMDARMQADHAFGGQETGLDDFDDMTGGFHGSELIILAARPSMGKTALALNMVEHVAIKCQQPSLFVSLEMSSIELVDRLLCSRAGVSGHRLRSGQISKEENQKIYKCASDISNAPLYIDDSPSRTMTEIAAVARRIKRREGSLALICIDYLQLIDPDSSSDPRQEQVAKIARRLKGLARELKVPVLCLAQLNRQVESSRDNKPQLTHLRESGAIEQDADVVMFIHREEYYQTNEEDRERVKGEADLLIRKQRNGPVGDVKLTWIADLTRFTNAAPKQYDEFDGFASTDEF